MNRGSNPLPPAIEIKGVSDDSEAPFSCPICQRLSAFWVQSHPEWVRFEIVSICQPTLDITPYLNPLPAASLTPPRRTIGQDMGAVALWAWRTLRQGALLCADLEPSTATVFAAPFPALGFGMGSPALRARGPLAHNRDQLDYSPSAVTVCVDTSASSFFHTISPSS